MFRPDMDKNNIQKRYISTVNWGLLWNKNKTTLMEHAESFSRKVDLSNTKIIATWDIQKKILQEITNIKKYKDSGYKRIDIQQLSTPYYNLLDRITKFEKRNWIYFSYSRYESQLFCLFLVRKIPTKLLLLLD